MCGLGEGDFFFFLGGGGGGIFSESRETSAFFFLFCFHLFYLLSMLLTGAFAQQCSS